MDDNDPNATTAAVATRVPDRPIGAITIGLAIAMTAAASLVIGIVLGPLLSGHPTLAADPTTSTEHVVTVSGMGEVSVAPDVADVILGVTIQKPTVAEAQSAAATAMAGAVAAVKKDGVADKDIVTTDVSLTPVYDYSTGGSAPRLVGQQFTNTVKLTVRNLSSVAAVIDDAISGGATTVSGITFRLNDPTAVQAQARKLAMADAKSKADALTSSAGVAVRGVASITETTATTPVYYGAQDVANLASGSASTPIQTGTTDILVQVTVGYLIG